MKKFFNSSLESENDGAYLRQQREGDEESKPESSSASVSASEPRSDAKIYIAIAFVVTLVFGSGILIGHYVIGNSDSSNNLEFQYDSTCTEPLVNSMDDRDAIISCLYDVNLKEDVVVPWSSDYYETSQVFSRFYQNYPLAIIYVRTEEEVAATMRCASTYNVRVSARSGGHGNSGNAVSTGAITIDLSNMTAVATNVSTDEVTNVTSAIAMVQAGNTAGTATYFILKQTNFTYTVPVGQKPTVGMGGLTLGGGFGFTTRHAGFLCDRVISIRAVTTNGDIIIANETHHSELLWASCGGGGGNFAVVTEFTYSMFPLLPEITEFHYHIDTTNVSSAAIAMRDYQIFSYHLDSRATCNMEVASQSSANMTGIFLGTVEEFEDVLANLTTELGEDLFPLEGWDLKSTTYIEAVLDLSGWETVTLESLRENFDSERNYYQFKSFLLQEPLPDIAMDMLLAAVNLTVPSKCGFGI